MRHRWVKLRLHFYICRKCGCGKENVDQGGGSWSTKYHRPSGVSEFRRHTPPCEVGPKTAAYLAKYAKEIAEADLTPKVLVCGGRDYSDWATLSSVLSEVGPKCVVNGAATGADELSTRWADEHGVAVRSYPADWAAFGKAAGPKRNQHMLEAESPDLVVAFPGGAGTADMVDRATKAGVPVRRVDRVSTQEAA